MRIFIGLHEIASYYLNLHRGFDALNINSTYACLGGQRFNYGIDELRKYPRVWAYYSAYKKHTQSRGNTFKGFLFQLNKRIQRLRFILWAVFYHDTFIFGFGTSFLPNNRDLYWLRLLRKKIIINLIHGSELRPMYLNGNNLDHNGQVKNPKQIIEGSIRIKERASRLERYGDALLAGPHNCQFLTRPFINHYEIGLPVYSEVQSIRTKGGFSGKLKVVHAPSNPRPKGTYVIRKLIERLIKKGISIEYVEIIDKPHDEVLKELGDADLILDQVYSDCPMAGLPTEGAAFGTPSLVAGLELEYIDTFIPGLKKPPVFLCNSSDLESKLEKVLKNHEERHNIGLQAKRFVNEVWGYKEVAKRFLSIVSSEVPDDWYLNPSDVNYIGGYGMNLLEWKEMISSCLGNSGFDSLYLDHNLALLNKVKSRLNGDKGI